MNNLKENVTNITDGLKDTIANYGDKVSDEVVDFKHKVADAADKCTNYMQDNPWKSVSIALVAGFVLSKILKS